MSVLRKPRFQVPERVWRVSLYLFVAAVMAFLVSPMLVILPLSFSSSPFLTFPPPGWSLQWYEAYLGSEQWMDATWLSLRIALMVTVCATVLGTLAAYGLSRAQFRGKRVLTGFIVSPMIVPIIILSIGVYHLYGRMQLIGTTTGIVLAHTVLALPFVFVTVTAGLQAVDVRLEHAARTLGASGFKTFQLVTLPLAKESIIAGAVFAFITSLDEVVIALFVGGSSAITLPKQMWDGIRNEINPTVTAVATVMIAVSVCLLATVAMLMRRKSRLEQH